MKNKIIIRPFNKNDSNEIDRVAIESFSEFKEKYNDWERIKKSVGSVSGLHKDSDILIAEINNCIVGGVALVFPGKDKNKNIDNSWATIRVLVVSPDHRSKGIAKKLTMECLKLARKKGYSAIGLYTSPIMSVAVKMYEKTGFIKIKNIGLICGVEYDLYKFKVHT